MLCNTNSVVWTIIYREADATDIARRQSDAASAAKYPKLTGRPHDEVRKEAFLQVIRYLEQNDDEQSTIEDLINHMRSVIAEENCEPYSFPYTKSQLLEHFGDRIIVAEVKLGNQMLLHSTVQLPGFCVTFTLKNAKIASRRKLA